MNNAWDSGFFVGLLIGSTIGSLSAMWAFSGAWREMLRLWNDHEEWLRRQIEKRKAQGDWWKGGSEMEEEEDS